MCRELFSSLDMHNTLCTLVSLLVLLQWMQLVLAPVHSVQLALPLDCPCL